MEPRTFDLGGIGGANVKYTTASRMALAWCALAWIAIIWLILLTLLVSLIAGKYTDDVSTLSNDDMHNMEIAFSELVNITNVVDEQLLYLNEHQPCIDGLCGSTPVAPDIYDSLVDLKCWNANTNSPALSSGNGTAGDSYIVCTAGNTSLDGHSTWYVDDFLFFLHDVYNGNRWVRYGKQFPSLVDNESGNQTIIINGNASTTPWILKQIADGGNGKITINDTDPANIIISLTSFDTEEQVRTYPTLTGSTTIHSVTNFNSSATILSEHWIRRGDMLHGTLVVQVSMGSVGLNRLELFTFPSEILAEINGTLTATSVWCDAHRTFSSSSSNDDYVYLLRACWVQNQTSILMEGETLSIGVGVVSPIRLMLTLVFDSLTTF